LICAGAFDSIKPGSRPATEWRAQLHAVIDSALARAQRARKSRLLGQDGLFGSNDNESPEIEELPPISEPWTRTQLLVAEKNALGFFITGHPLEDYVDLLRQMNAVRSVDLPTLVNGNRISVGGIVSDLQIRTTKKGDRFALFRLEDDSGGTKCVCWPEAFGKHSSLLQAELPALVIGRLELSEDNPPSLIVDKVQRLDGVRVKKLPPVLVRLSSREDELFDGLLEVLHQHPGSEDVVLEVPLENDVCVRIRANQALRVANSEALVSALKQIGCSVNPGAKPAFSSATASVV
jgi:DNA polymerase-3 subunit alpha